MAVDDASSPRSRVHAESKQERDVDDSDLDPAAFLKSVRELSEKREREDAERFRKLEEEVQKSREERAARRTERAESISPQKQPVLSPASRTIARPTVNASLPPIVMASPSSAGASDKTSVPPRDSANIEPEKKAAAGESVPEFKGFGGIKRSSTASMASQSSASAQKVTDDSTQSATGFARFGTLTWNRRPQSQLGGSRPQSQAGGPRPRSQLGGSRPQSMVAESKPTHTRDSSIDKLEPSRNQIATSLGARDLSWFKQTADRSIGNAAYRTSKDEAQVGDNTAFGRRGLPGMSRDLPSEADSQISPPTSASTQSEILSRGGSVRGSTISAGSRFSATSSVSSGKPDLKALIAEDEDQQRSSPAFDQASITSTESSVLARTLTMSSSQARLANSQERPASPTKGMGGFVQSAMMKRTDSQTKRWSAQPGASLSRTNSIASARSGAGGLQGSHSMPKLEPTATTKETADESDRPTSSSNDLTSLVTKQDNDGFVKPALPSHSRSKSIASNYSTNDDIPSSPGSPSKRFSPTKSSWLESSLTRPESPKPAPAKNSQPSWMADLASRKAQRASADSTPLGATPKPAEEEGSRPGSPTKQTPSGQQILTRSDSRDLPTTSASATPTNKLRPIRLADKFEQSSAGTSTPSSKAVPNKTLDDPIHLEPSIPIELANSKPTASAENRTDSAQAEEDASSITTTTFQSESSPPLKQTEMPATPEAQVTRKRSKSFKSPPPSGEKPKAEAAPGLPTDFRSQLKSRPAPQSKPSEQPEFLSKFGNLRKIQQERYVAPDVLKDNITRGKSELTKTSGPVKTQRRDELKESLVAKKDDMKKAKEEGRDLPGQVHERKISASAPQAPSKPEALAKRELLGRSDSSRSAISSTERGREATPEALSRHKSLRSRPTNELPKEAASPKQTPSTMPKPMTSPKPSNTSDPVAAKSAITRKDASEAKSESLSRQTSSSSVTEAIPTKETSKLASRFNPGLANMLARGPPSQPSSRSGTPGASGQPVSPPQNAASEPPAAGAPLNDMRKDRAKGPKRRKAGAKAEVSSTMEAATTSTLLTEETMQETESKSQPTIAMPKPTTVPKSTAAIMRASLDKSAPPIEQKSRDAMESSASNSPAKSSPPESRPNFSRPKPIVPPGFVASVMNGSLNKSPRPISMGPYGEEEPADPPGTPKSPPKPHQVESPPLSLSPLKKQQSRALPGSMSSVMMASLKQSPQSDQKPQEADAKPGTEHPTELKAPRKSPSLTLNSVPVSTDEPPVPAPSATVPEFKGFGASRAQKMAVPIEADKENNGGQASVKAAASIWGRRRSPQKTEAPEQIQLPTKRDEDAAMRSAGLLAASPKPGLGISIDRRDGKPPTPVSIGAPPKPAKSSRAVSGQLSEASPNQSDSPLTPEEPPKTEAGRLLLHSFGKCPKYREQLAINISSVILNNEQRTEAQNVKTLRRSVLQCFPDGSFKTLPAQAEYTLYDESVFLCTHIFLNAKGSKSAQIYLWAGDSAFETTIEAAAANAKRISKENGSAAIMTVRQGQEPAVMLQAFGGILVTRRGSSENAPKQFMLCGRKHLGHIVFDEVDFGVESLCAGFVFLISYPITLQQTKLYVWKGSACSTEELSGARLAAMDLSETGEIIEVDGGVEFASFLKIFGSDITKSSIARPSEFWQQKATAPEKFQTRLFRIVQAEMHTGLLTAFWNRRPSWNSLSPARSPTSAKDDVKVEAKEITPYSQSQLEAEGVYLLDGWSEIYVLIGPLFGSQTENIRNALLGQVLLFASDYAIMAASMEDRPGISKCWVLFSGVPRDLKMLFRHWDEGRGLWGTAGLMAGESANPGREVNALALEGVLNEVCRD